MTLSVTSFLSSKPIIFSDLGSIIDPVVKIELEANRRLWRDLQRYTTTVSGVLPAASFPALDGDITTVAGDLTTTLASVISAGGPTGSTSVVPVITYDAKGRLTAVTTATINGLISNIQMFAHSMG